VTNPHSRDRSALFPADADSYFQAPVFPKEIGDEKLTGPSFKPCLAGENRSVQPQSTNLSTAFVDNSAGPHFAHPEADNPADFVHAICDTSALQDALHKVAGPPAFG